LFGVHLYIAPVPALVFEVDGLWAGIRIEKSFSSYFGLFPRSCLIEGKWGTLTFEEGLSCLSAIGGDVAEWIGQSVHALAGSVSRLEVQHRGPVVGEDFCRVVVEGGGRRLGSFCQLMEMGILW
jgi:hypothetical protein